jgi:hypothetical protein
LFKKGGGQTIVWVGQASNITLGRTLLEGIGL